jgi:hypothetical protein
MGQSPTRIIMGQFSDQQAADSGIETIRMAARANQIAVHGAAFVQNDAHHRMRVSPLVEFGAGQMSLLLRMLHVYNGGLILAIRTTGAIVNSITGLATQSAVRVINRATGLFDWAGGSVTASPIPTHSLESLGEELPQGTSAIVAIVDEKSLQTTRSLLEKTGAIVVIANQPA